MQNMLFGLNCNSIRTLAYDFAKANNIPAPFNHIAEKAGKD